MLNLPRWRPGKLARNGSSLLVWMTLRAAAQAGIVVLLARQLGAQPYGVFVAIIAVASFFTPFAGLGLSQMLLRNVARDPTHMPTYLARAMRWWARSIAPCIVIAIIAAVLLLPNGFPLLAMFAGIAAEVVAGSLTELRARHLQAQQKINAFGAINAGLPATRLLALGILFVAGRQTGVATVLYVYAGSGFLYVLATCLPVVAWSHALDTSVPEPMTATSGLPFSLSVFAVKLQAEFNKPVLARSSAGLAGTYNVAQRMVDMASLPLSAIYESLWPRLYAQKDPTRQLYRSGTLLVIIALLLGAILWFAAPILPWALGSSFLGAVHVVRWLAWLPLLQVFRYIINFYIIHHAWMTLIGWAYAAGGAASITLVATLVPRYGIASAVLVAYLTELVMIATLAIGCLWHLRK